MPASKIQLLYTRVCIISKKGQWHKIEKGRRNTRLHTNRTNLDSTAYFYPYRITKIGNALPQTLQTTLKTLAKPLVMKQFIVPHYQTKLLNQFDSEDTCTWISRCDCSRCNRYK